MPRTKKHFRPPSSSSSSSSSEEEEEDNNYNNQVVQRGRGKVMPGNFGTGKQLSVAAPPGGRGKQLRAPQQESEEESSEESSSEEEEEEAPSPSRGKQLRPVGRGKQLRAPSQPPAAKDEESDSSTSAYKQPPPAAAAAVSRGGGKQFGTGVMGGGRGGGKQLGRTPTVDEEEDSSSSSDEEPWAAPRGQGKQLRPPPAAAAPAKDESDMEESSEEEEEEEEEVQKEPPKKAAAKPARAPPAAKKKPEPEEEEEEDEDSEESDFEPEQKAPPPKRRGRPPRAAATRAAKSTRAAAKKEISSEEEEEEEEEEPSEESDGSESSSDEEQEWDMEKFDMQKLVKGGDDQKYLDSLTELERENILAERFEKLKSEADMKKALRENKRREREQKKSAGGAKKKKAPKKRAAPKAKKAAAPAKKRARAAAKKKAPVEETESEDDEEPDTAGDEALAQSLAGKRVSARNLDKKGKQFKKQAALAKIRANRANKAAVAEESDSDLDYGRDSDDSDDDYEDELKPWQQKTKKTTQLAESSDDESMGIEDDQQTPTGQSQRRSEDIEAELDDYIKVSIPRRRLMRWCNEPYFEKAVKGFYVRLGIGRDNKSQKAIYRLCKIEGIVAKSEYSFPPANNQTKAISTDKWLKVSFGTNKREFKMITVSDHRPSSEDVTKLVSLLKNERLVDSILTKKSANKLRKRQDELVNNYTYTKEDIDMLVKEKKKRNKKAMNIGLEKTRIAIAVQAAKDAVEDAKKRVEDAEIEATEADEDMTAIAENSVTKAKEALDMAKKKLEETLEEQKRIHKDDQDRINKLKQSSKVQNWVKVNQRAKMANRDADFQAYKEQLAKAKQQGSAEPKFDPYARRRVKPKNLWEVGSSSKSNDKASEAVEEEKKETSPSERDDSNAGKDGDRENNREEVPEPQKMVLPGQANQMAFDDDIMMGGDIATLGGLGKKKTKTRARKGISLEEYQERKTAGTL